MKDYTNRTTEDTPSAQKRNGGSDKFTITHKKLCPEHLKFNKVDDSFAPCTSILLKHFLQMQYLLQRLLGSLSNGLSPIKTKDEHVTMKVERPSNNACREKASSRLSIS